MVAAATRLGSEAVEAGVGPHRLETVSARDVRQKGRERVLPRDTHPRRPDQLVPVAVVDDGAVTLLLAQQLDGDLAKLPAADLTIELLQRKLRCEPQDLVHMA